MRTVSAMRQIFELQDAASSFATRSQADSDRNTSGTALAMEDALRPRNERLAVAFRVGLKRGYRMDWTVTTLREYPEAAIFLALALGYWIGGLRIGSFSLRPVTGTLLMGVLIGQLHVTVSANVKATFLLMFLFAVVYGAGPEFFRSLKYEGVL